MRLGYGLTNRLYEERDLARSAGGRDQPELLHELAGGAGRSAVSDRLQHPAAQQVLAGGFAVRASPTDWYRRTSHGAGPHHGHLPVGRRQRGGQRHQRPGERRVDPVEEHPAADWGSDYDQLALPAGVDDAALDDQQGRRHVFVPLRSFRDQFLQQRYFAYYNAQCCGVLVEYQTYNIVGLADPQDRRFNVSFTLAGIGTFSNFLGAFGGQTNREHGLNHT